MPARNAEAIDKTDRPDRVAYSMRALGQAGLPRAFNLNDRTYTLFRTVKHDFFAATAFYRDNAGRTVVLKVSRTTDFAGVPHAAAERSEYNERSAAADDAIRATESPARPIRGGAGFAKLSRSAAA